MLCESSFFVSNRLGTVHNLGSCLVKIRQILQEFVKLLTQKLIVTLRLFADQGRHYMSAPIFCVQDFFWCFIGMRLIE